jgi:hypothetical protein
MFLIVTTVVLTSVLTRESYGQQGLEVQIVGEIIDREQAAVVVWGVALPRDQYKATAFGAVLKEATLLVLNPKLTNPVIYEGMACFIGKDQGVNRFGAPVPVWIYGPCEMVPKASK